MVKMGAKSGIALTSSGMVKIGEPLVGGGRQHTKGSARGS